MENKEIITTLVRLNNWLKILSVFCEKNCEYYSLGEIIIYNENGIIVKNNRGYFDNDKTFSFKGEVIKKVKEDFSKKINYVKKITDSNNIWNNNYALYIHEDNVNIEYKGLDKRFSSVYKVYTVNGIEFTTFIKDLKSNYWNYRGKIEDTIKTLQSCVLPLKQEELKVITDTISHYNQLLEKEEKFIKDYIPNEEDLKDNFEKVLKRKE